MSSYEFPKVDFEKLKDLVGDRLRKTYIQEKHNVLLESHYHGGLYALKAFLKRDEYRPYISQLIQEDGQNAIKFLRALTSFGLQTSEKRTRTFRILNYQALKFFTEPREVRQSLDRLGPVQEISEDEKWAVNALTEGIEAEARGESVEEINEMQQEMRRGEIAV